MAAKDTKTKAKTTTEKKAPAKKTTAAKTVTKKATASKKASPVKTTSKAVTRKAPASKTPAQQLQPQATASAPASVDNLFGIAPYEPKKGEEYMSDEQMEHFRSILMAWKSQLMQDVDSTLNFMQDESSSLPDVNDRATQEEEFAVKLRTRDRERKLIRKIDKSIAEIDADEYGFCQTCGVEIGLKRLEARPTATECIDCKTLAEIKEQQTHGGM